jgi:hypothetical protein
MVWVESPNQDESNVKDEKESSPLNVVNAGAVSGRCGDVSLALAWLQSGPIRAHADTA